VGCLYTPYDASRFVVTAPSADGGADWPPSAIDPRTGMMYICSKESSMIWKSLPESQIALHPLGNFSDQQPVTTKNPSTNVTGTLVAMNLRTNHVVWKRYWAHDTCYSGVTVTQSGLVLVGRNSGHVQAYDERNGTLLWTSPRLAAGADAPPMTYMINGKQYIVIYAGGNGIASIVAHLKPRYGNDIYGFALP